MGQSRDSEGVVIKNENGIVELGNPLDVDLSSITPENPLPTSNVDFNTNDIDEATSTITYIGAEDKTGNWYVKKIDTTTNCVFSHATENNNPSHTTYNDAWSNRATLTYGNYGDAF